MTSQNPGEYNSLLAVGALPGIIAGPITSVWVVGSSNANTLVEDVKASSDISAHTSSTSYEVHTVDPTTHRTKGYKAGSAGETGAIVLSFGQTLRIGTQYGASVYGTPSTTAVIGQMAKSFADGYHKGFIQTGMRCPGISVCTTIAVGITNNHDYGPPALNLSDAQAWSDMVTDIKNYISTKGYSEIQIAAAIDAEPDWSSYSDAAAWQSAYLSHHTSILYNFGSTDGYSTCTWRTNFPSRASVAAFVVGTQCGSADAPNAAFCN